MQNVTAVGDAEAERRGDGSVSKHVVAQTRSV
jgi:hypothetical protein